MCDKPTARPRLSGDLPWSPMAAPALERGSRRRRIWELGSHAHCPVIGVCLPLAGLRRLAGKVMGGQVLASDYELHCGAIAECRQRSPMALALQRELDRRYALPLQQTTRLKSSEALALWWAQTAKGAALPGCFWALLTHPRCDTALEEAVLAQVHMLQHQVGSLARADMARMDELMEENALLARQLGKLQNRSTQQQHALQLRNQQLEADLMRTRAELISTRTVCEQLTEQLNALSRQAPDLPAREALLERNQMLNERLQQLQRQLARTESALLALQRRGSPCSPGDGPPCQPPKQVGRTADAEPLPEPIETHSGPPPPAPLASRAVLCVGGRPASVPIYRQLIEDTGGQFLHHDGGEEDKPTQLDASLAAADLVICQTGCISHDAYWRVKDHCKRTGKQCVFVDTPSRSALVRALEQLDAQGVTE